MNTALILSGGTGTRLGADIPKQYIKINEKPIIYYCMERIFESDYIDAVQIVADNVWRDFILGSAECTQCMKNSTKTVSDNATENSAEGFKEKFKEKFKGFSDPGKNRQLSILNGLEDIRAYADDTSYIFIHDAARPLLKPEFIRDCFEAVKGHDGALPVLPMKDTVYLSIDGGSTVASLLDRSTVYAGQAPEIFILGKYYEANRRLLPDEIMRINGSTEPAVMAGMDIAMMAGDENNFKITTKADLERFEQIIIQKERSADDM